MKLFSFLRRKPVVPFPEIAAQQPPAPCGKQLAHYEWELLCDLPCPNCSAQRQRRRELAKQEQLAQLIADAIVTKLQAQK